MQTAIEAFGYFASLLVLISLVMTSVVKLRMINCIGSTCYVVYALIIHSYPTAFMNACLVAVNVYYLLKLQNQKVVFDLQRMNWKDGSVQRFLKLQKADIAKHFPNFTFTVSENDIVFAIFAGLDFIGLAIVEEVSDGALFFKLDYTVPTYRDCSVGKYLYQRLFQKGARRLCFAPSTPDHDTYLKKMGFQMSSGMLVKER